jgi:hypothetical protein
LLNAFFTAMKNLRIFLSLFLLAAVLGSTLTAQAQQRRFSPQAKGTVIGAGGGAILGAVINKRNRKVGGLIGGLAGAGAGYAVGKHIDNRQKKRAAAIAAVEREAAYREAANRRAYLASRPATAPRTAGVTSYAPAAATAAVAGTTALAAASVIPGYPAMATASAYLPNQAPTDPSNPYAGTAYRQRSW